MTLPALAALVAVGLLVAVALAALPASDRDGVARSLDLARGPALPTVKRHGGGDPDGAASDGGFDPGSEPLSRRLWGPVRHALGLVGARLTPVGTPARLRRRLDLAGNAPPWDLQTVLVLKAVGTLGLGGIGLLTWLASRSVAGLTLFVLLAGLGYWLGDLLLHNVGVKRQDALRRAAPDALDMLTVCVEAGLGFDAALAQVASNSRGPLAEEFARVLKEIQLGRSRAEAFSDLAGRTDVSEIKTFVGALVQADRLGVPIAGVLREQAGELRLRRRQRAEENAQKVPVKIIFPVMFCIFPVFFVIVIGPGVIRIAEVFSHG